MMDFRQLRPSSFTGYHRSHGLSNSRDLLVSDGHGDGPRVSAQTAPVGSPRCCPDNCTYGRDASFEYSERRKECSDPVTALSTESDWTSVRFKSSTWRRRLGQLLRQRQPITVGNSDCCVRFAVLRDGSTVPCFVMHQGSERHCVRCDGRSGRRTPGRHKTGGAPTKPPATLLLSVPSDVLGLRFALP